MSTVQERLEEKSIRRKPSLGVESAASSADDGWLVSHSKLISRGFIAFSLARVPKEGGGCEEIHQDYKPRQEEADVEAVIKNFISTLECNPPFLCPTAGYGYPRRMGGFFKPMGNALTHPKLT